MNNKNHKNNRNQTIPMKTKTNIPTRLLLTASAAVLCAAATASAQITLPMVTVGDPGNPGDTSTTNNADGHVGLHDLGAVSYTYNIGKYDVTVSQYTAFLNKVAATDPYGLYNTDMEINPHNLVITRVGASGSYSYAVVSGMGNHPVTDVSWYSAARFSNWLSNGQPTGGEVNGVTETGAYTLNGNTGMPSYNGTGLYRLPTESEWYKAAYYDPSIAGANKYWAYATRSNTEPGNIVGSGANMANYLLYNGSNYIFSVTQSSINNPLQSYQTDVGAFTGSASAYGTFDQNGDASNWNDATFSTAHRGRRGGSYNTGSGSLVSSCQTQSYVPTDMFDDLGFRIASVPEPTTAALLLGGGALLALRRRRSPAGA